VAETQASSIQEVAETQASSIQEEKGRMTMFDSNYIEVETTDDICKVTFGEGGESFTLELSVERLEELIDCLYQTKLEWQKETAGQFVQIRMEKSEWEKIVKSS
jgi:hypothetical protein